MKEVAPMESPNPWSPGRQSDHDDEQEIIQKQPFTRKATRAGTIAQNISTDTLEKPGMTGSEFDSLETQQDLNIFENKCVNTDVPGVQEIEILDVQNARKTTKPLPAEETMGDAPVPETPIPTQELAQAHAPSRPLKKGTALLLITFLGVIVLHTLTLGPTSFLGSQGWASVLDGPAAMGNANLLKNIDTHLKQNTQHGTKARAKAQITPQQYINLIVNRMTLDQKLGQMMIVQFTGSTYSLPISAMISQYDVWTAHARRRQLLGRLTILHKQNRRVCKMQRTSPPMASTSIWHRSSMLPMSITRSYTIARMAIRRSWSRRWRRPICRDYRRAARSWARSNIFPAWAM